MIDFAIFVTHCFIHCDIERLEDLDAYSGSDHSPIYQKLCLLLNEKQVKKFKVFLLYLHPDTA